MTSLRETIENFHAYVLEKNTHITQQIIGFDEDFKDVRLGVYQEGYFLRLLEGLSRDFPATEKLVGGKKFEKLGREYIRSFPSTHFSVRYVGQHFRQFLADKSELNPALAQMAAFEWALENAIDAKDAHQLTFDEMAKLSPESWSELKLKLHPSVEILSLGYAIPPLWQYLLQKKGEKRPPLKRQRQETHWLIWRFNHQSYFRPMDTDQLWMVRAIQKGKTFSEICAGLCEYLEEVKVVPFAAQTLRTWITEGVFSEYNVS